MQIHCICGHTDSASKIVNLAAVIIQLPSLLFLFLQDSDTCQALGWERKSDGT